MKMNACGFRWELSESFIGTIGGDHKLITVLNVYLTKEQLFVSFQDAYRLGNYLSREGFMENTNSFEIHVYSYEDAELKYDQLTETFCLV